MKALFFLHLCICLSAIGKPLKLALNWKAEPQFGGFYEAEDKKIFKKNGLDVEIQQGGSGTPTLQLLLSGQTDYAVVSGDEIVIAADRGNKDVVAIFAVYQKNPQGIMLRESNSAKDLQSLLRGTGTLLWQEGLPYAQFLKKKYGPLKLKTAPYLGGLGPFAADSSISQQCFVTSEPLLAEKQNLKVKTFLVAESGYNPYTTVVVVKRDRLQKQPEEVQKMISSIRAGWEGYLQDPKSSHGVMQKLNPAMSFEALEQSAKAQKPLIETTKGKPLGAMTLERWQTLVSQLKELKLIDREIDAKTLFQSF